MEWKWESDLAKASLKRLLEARVTPTPLLASSFSGSFVLQNHYRHYHDHHHHHHHPSPPQLRLTDRGDYVKTNLPLSDR